MPPEYEESEIHNILDRSERVDQAVIVSKSPRLPVLCGACRSPSNSRAFAQVSEGNHVGKSPSGDPERSPKDLAQRSA